jgi:RHS repeat-associated protein
VESIENGQRQKCAVKVDRKQMLRTFVYSPNNTVEIDYYRSSELLRSRRDSSGLTYMYDYDSNGRVEKAITPTGGIIQLRSDISIYGAMVNITRNNKKQISLLIQKSFVHKSMDHEVEIVQIESDRSFITESKWGHKFAIQTAPYILLQGEDPGLAESFPVPSIERTEIGEEVVNQVEWDYYADGPAGQATSVGKTLTVNGESVLSVQLDRRTGGQVIRVDSRQMAVSINRTRHSSQVSSQPAGVFPTITEQFNAIGLPTSWSMGSLVETYSYDQANRLKEVRHGDSPGSLEYIYPDSFGQTIAPPVKVVIPSGGGFLLSHDPTGALQSISTPRGHVHGFQVQLGLNSYKLNYQAPWSRSPYSQQYDQTGALLAKTYPANTGKVIFIYDAASHLRAVIGGASTIHYHYIPGTALINSIDISDDTFHMKTRKKHHRGSVKEIQQVFLNNEGLNNYTLKYQYDATGRLSTTSLDVLGLTELTTLIKYDQRTGKLKGLSDLRISQRSFNLVIMEDLTKNFVREKKYDEYGRFESLNLIIKSQPRFRVNIEYNANSQISLKSEFLLHRTINQEVAYNTNNQINVVRVGSESEWVYTHDTNGNIVSVTEQGHRTALGFDSGDRVVQFGDLEFVTYDQRGFVIRRGEQRYSYNAFGQMTSAFEPGKFAVQFFYDDEKRLLGSSDHRGNTVQYIYGNPSVRGQVTHVHYPKLGQVQQLFYDEEGLLVAMEASDNRFYIGTDETGSPLVIFDTRGKMIKQVKRTPFGRTMHDSNPNHDMPIDFHGGLLDKHTRLIHFGDRVYDPVLGQWMTPDWEGLGKDIHSPFDVFTYRFMNNNPMNRDQDIVRFKGKPDKALPLAGDIVLTPASLSGPSGWLALVGLDTKDVVGSEYMTKDIVKPAPVHRTKSAFDSNPEINLAIKESYELSRAAFLSPSFLPEKHQLSEIKRRLNLSPRITVRNSIFGDGMLLSLLDGRIIVTLVSGAVNEVFQSVFSSILNGSEMLNIESPTEVEEYVFMKEQIQYGNDVEELERLSGSYNISKGLVRGGGQQVCVQSRAPSSVICILYGAKEERALRQRLRQGHREAVRAKWEQEVTRVKLGFHGEWSASERDTLLRTGEVRGFTGEEVHSVHKFPQLAGQASNVRFVRENQM